MSIVLSACREDFDYLEAYRQNPEFVYRENFEKAYGTINPDQCWDFTVDVGGFETRAGSTYDYSFDGGISFDVKPSINNGTINNSSINSNTAVYNAIKNQDFSDISESDRVYSFCSNGEEFSIYPVTTKCDYQYDMYIQVGNDNPVLVFSKDWNDGSYAYCNGMATKTSQSTDIVAKWVNLDGSNGTKVYTFKSRKKLLIKYYSIDHAQTRSNPKYLSESGAQYALFEMDGGQMFLYIIADKNFVNLSIEEKGLLKNKYPKFSLVDNISAASAFSYDQTGLSLKLGSYYIFNNTLIDGLGVKSNKSNSDGYKWDIVASTTNAPDKSTITSDKSLPLSKLMPGLTVNNVPLGTPISIYIKKTDNSTNSNVKELKSVTAKIEEFEDDDESDMHYECRYFGVDGNNDGKYNDLTFAIVGSNATKSYGKRYMVEDLGAVTSSDIDFNDVVFDLSYDITGIVPDKSNIKAKVRAMGGTLDFTLKVGNTEVFKKSTASSANLNQSFRNDEVKASLSRLEVETMYNTGAAENTAPFYEGVMAEIPVTGWDPANNNVSVVVEGKTSGLSHNNSVTEPTVITFPANGTVPAMIAVPVTQEWNYERVSVFKTSDNRNKVNLSGNLPNPRP